jgi:ABC-type glycerol-3-phosphate transport system substrate-binding protein
MKRFSYILGVLALLSLLAVLAGCGGSGGGGFDSDQDTGPKVTTTIDHPTGGPGGAGESGGDGGDVTIIVDVD